MLAHELAVFVTHPVVLDRSGYCCNGGASVLNLSFLCFLCSRPPAWVRLLVLARWFSDANEIVCSVYPDFRL